jgi:hypothetical protein
MRDLIELFCMMAVVMLVGIVLVVGPSNWHGSYQCRKYETITGKATKWVPLDECYVQTADGWQRWDEYKLRAVASEGLSHTQ